MVTPPPVPPSTADEAAESVDDLRARMQKLERLLRDLSAQLAIQLRERRLAERQAHAERSLRLELQEELADRDQDALRRALGDLAAAEHRIRELEDELARVRRRAVEVEHFAAVERARANGALRAERAVAQRARTRAAANGAAAGTGLAVAPLPSPSAHTCALQHERAALQHERAAREHRLAGPSPGLASGGEGADPNLAQTLAALRSELDELRAGVERATAASAGELDPLRAAAQSARPGSAPSAPAAPGPQRSEPAPVEAARSERAPAPELVQAERLQAALARLREATPRYPVDDAPVDDAQDPAVPSAPVDDAPVPESEQPSVPPAALRRAWLADVFKRLAGEDPLMAGELLLALLPAQHVIHAEPLAYDLILRSDQCIRVTVRGGAQELRAADSPRPRAEVDFQVAGEAASIARTLVAGRFRRRFGRGMAHVSGDKRGFEALRELVRAPLELHELYAAGVRLQAPLAFVVIAMMIDPADTVGERFTIAHRAPGAAEADRFLHVDDGKRPVADALGDPALATTIVCAGESVPAAIAGAATAEVEVRGERWPLELLARWLERAQTA